MAKRSKKSRTRTSAARRFKITATGKVMRRTQNFRHLRRKKSKRAIRRAKVPKQITGKFAKKIKRMLGVA
ncbi:MAG: 50S ribosomal protein L35 [Candidatus Chisholmbacteria bacterium]|nr:50S ribosomal protein L35 [Candidatus Chisholmbacteria bacterium]